MAKAKLVHERVYQVGGQGLSDTRDCLCYAILTKDQDVVMVDCGAGVGLQNILRVLGTIDVEPSWIKWLILTHGHIDHIGGAAELVKETGCKVLAHEGDLDAITGQNMLKTAADWYGIDYIPVEVDEIIKGEGGTKVIGDLELHFLHTPGHTPGSMVVYLDIGGKRVLFGQDIHGPFDPAFSSDIKQWRRSMEKLLALNADILCEGHYGIFRGKDNVAQFIQGFLDQNI